MVINIIRVIFIFYNEGEWFLMNKTIEQTTLFEVERYGYAQTLEDILLITAANGIAIVSIEDYIEFGKRYIRVHMEGPKIGFVKMEMGYIRFGSKKNVVEKIKNLINIITE